MNRASVVAASLVWLTAALLRAQAPVAPQAEAPLAAPPAGHVDFTTQIKPIFDEWCSDCHDGETRKGGLSLATYADVLEGGRSGAMVRPGASARSLLMDRLTGVVDPRMPKDDDPLDAATIGLVRAWIDEGARETPNGPPAPQPWDAPFTLTRPELPAQVWPAWTTPVDRLVAAYLTDPAARQPDLRGPSPATHTVATVPPTIADAQFARRAYLDVWGLLPDPEALQAFVADPSPDKRARLVTTLLADDERYAGHWMTFWNDLLRNEDGVSYFSERDGRKSITPWLLNALERNLPYDRFVASLLDPRRSDDPRGFLIGVNWRGETSAAVTPWMQASQNTAQVFLGVNMKCNACHDSFVSRWKLKDAYGLAAFFSPDARLRLYRCDVARDEYTGPQFPFAGLPTPPRSEKLDDRRAAAAQLFTDPRNGRMPRTVVNRVWTRLLGHGIVANSDEMDGRPWSPALLDWLASDFVAQDYDLRHLIATIMSSQAYQMPSMARPAEPSAKAYVFEGPEVRRLTAEQFADAVGTMTGEWNTWSGPSVARRSTGSSTRLRLDSDPRSVGVYAREWRAASTTLTRALGRPARDQVTSTRPSDATTPQALELVNGELLTQWLERGARRLTGDMPADTYSRYTAAIAGRAPKARGFDLPITPATASVWLVVRDTGSNVPERVRPVWLAPVLVDRGGHETPLASLTPVVVEGAAPASRQRDDESPGDAIAVDAPSVLRYDIDPARFVRLRGRVDVANPRSEIGSTLNPSVRFFVFDAAPDLTRLLPPGGQLPLPSPPPPSSAAALVDRVFWQALGRAPSDDERALAERAIADPARPGRLSPTGVADLLWAVLMKPEFQLIY